MNLTPEWYFFILISLTISLAWIKLIYGRFINDFFSAATNYNSSYRIFREPGIVKKRVGYSLDIIYLFSGGLFLYNLFEFYNIKPFNYSGIHIFVFSLLVLLALIILRLFIMGIISIIFNRKEMISEFIYHFYLYNKMLGLSLMPFLFLIPYTQGILQQIIVYMSFTIVAIVYLYRFVRIFIFLIKNVVFIFYLFLYLCVLEIMPLMVFIKFLLSL